MLLFVIKPIKRIKCLLKHGGYYCFFARDKAMIDPYITMSVWLTLYEILDDGMFNTLATLR